MIGAVLRIIEQIIQTLLTEHTAVDVQPLTDAAKKTRRKQLMDIALEMVIIVKDNMVRERSVSFDDPIRTTIVDLPEYQPWLAGMKAAGFPGMVSIIEALSKPTRSTHRA